MALDGKTFKEVVAAQNKIDSGAMTLEQASERLRQHLRNPPVKEICPLCNEPITAEENLDPLGPQFIKVTVGDVETRSQVHADCYFDEMGKEIDEHPIGRGKPARGVRFGGDD